jgi:hypothetical protein
MKEFNGASGLEHISEDASCKNAFLETVRLGESAFIYNVKGFTISEVGKYSIIYI